MDYLGDYGWICDAEVETSLKQPWLESLAQQEGFRPLMLNAVRGSYSLLGEGALRLTFGISPMSFEEAVEEGETITGMILAHMRLNDKVKHWSISLRGYSTPESTTETQAKIIPFPHDE